MKFENDKNFATAGVVEMQLNNICRILGGEANHYICTDKKTQHQKIVITYDHKEKCKQ